MILILGKGTLGTKLADNYKDQHVALVGKPDFDFSIQSECDRLVDRYSNPAVVINTMGTMSSDAWTNLTTNFLAPAYITLQYLKTGNIHHIINISSASAWWVSYPGLDLGRFSYNISKESLSNLGRHLNRVIIDQQGSTVTTVEPGGFQSPMSKHTGMNIDQVANAVDLAITHRLQHISLIK